MVTWRLDRAKGRKSGPAPEPPDIITYRYNGELAYVPVAPNYDLALSHVRDAFPQLKNCRDASLSLSLTSSERRHTGNSVNISAPTWPTLTAQMSRYQIIDVRSTNEQAGNAALSIPKITITFADTVDDAKEKKPAPLGTPRTQTTSTSKLQSRIRRWLSFRKLH